MLHQSLFHANEQIVADSPALLIESLEEEYDTKLEELQKRQKQELASSQGEHTDDEQPDTAAAANVESEPPAHEQQEEEEDPQKAARERKQAKVRRKREQQRQKQKELEAEQDKDLAGPSARNDELEILKSKLDPLSLKVIPVASDGHCLYRAVAAQCQNMDYSQMREFTMSIGFF